MPNNKPLYAHFNDAGEIVSLADESGEMLFSGLGTLKARGMTQVATRCRVQCNFSNANHQVMTRTYHHARDIIKTMKVAFANWWVQNGVEQATGGAATLRATVEYPAGTVLGRFMFGGNDTANMQDMQTALSDELVLSAPIPKGETFFVRAYYVNAAGIVFEYVDAIGSDQAGGDCTTYAAAGVADLTGTGGPFANTNASLGYRPVAIIANTQEKSYAIAGDSKAAGRGDSASDGTGFGGVLERSIGPSSPFINIASPGAVSTSFSGPGSNLRRQLLAFISEGVVIDVGTNDVTAATPAATVFDNIVQARQSVPRLKFWTLTQAPITTGTWVGANGAGQAVTGNDGIRVTLNNLMMSAVNTIFTGAFDVCSQLEYSPGAAKWQANFTADGFHSNQAACQAVAASGVVAP